MVSINTSKKKNEMEIKILDQMNILYPNKSILNLTLCTIEENIVLWNIKMEGYNNLYFYTDKNGNVLFKGQLFFYASAFSNNCAIVIPGNQKPYIINLRKNELIQIPIDKMAISKIGNIHNGNITIFSENNHWGSYTYQEENHFFENDIPCIWDALEFSKDGKKVAAGLCSYQTILGDTKHDNTTLKIKIMEISKEYAYDLKTYQQFLKYLYETNQNCLEIIHSKNNEITEEDVRDFIMQNHDIFGYERKTNLNQCTNRTNPTIETRSLEEYQRIRGKIKR